MSGVLAGALTILIVDPDPVSQRIIFDALHTKYHIVSASSIADAARKIMMHHPAILLLEINQPDGDGYMLIQQIRKDPSTHNMIVACVTNRSTVQDKLAGFRAGTDDYIVKPINPDSFPWRMILLSRLRSLTS